MAKSKNHTNHNQNHKAHRNVILKPNIKEELKKKRGVDKKFLKNQRFARLGTIKAVRIQARKAAREALKAAPAKPAVAAKK